VVASRLLGGVPAYDKGSSPILRQPYLKSSPPSPWERFLRFLRTREFPVGSQASPTLVTKRGLRA